MRPLVHPPTLFWAALALLIAPSFQATIWSAPGAIVPLKGAQEAPPPQPSHSLFRIVRDNLIELIWPRPSRESNKKHCHEDGAHPVASEQYLKRYGSEVVLRFKLKDDKERQALSEAADTLFLDVWEFTSKWADVRLSKDMVEPLYGLLPQSIESKPLIHDLAQAVFESQSTAVDVPIYPPSLVKVIDGSSELAPVPRSNPFFEKYQPLSVIIPWMRLLQSMFATHVRVFDIGTSFEGQTIPAIRVGSHPHNAKRYESPRKTIVVVGGLHAREWISTAAVNYAAYELITAYGKNRQMTKLIEEFDFIFIPTLNPDGYVYTWEHDRLWRKTRQQTHLSFCPGLDLDRSFGFEWNGESTKGNPCSESYAGESGFAATEASEFAKWLRNETENNNAHIVGFLDFHSYSQQILYPYSYTCDRAPAGYEDLQELAIGLQKAMHVTNGKSYTVASACEGGAFAFPMSASGGGSALDWVYNQSVRYSYQVKLPDTGSYGFLLPSKNIVPTGREIFNAITYFSQFLLSSSIVEAHDDSPSTKEPVFVSSVPSSQQDSVLKEKIGTFMSHELAKTNSEEPVQELRKRH